MKLRTPIGEPRNVVFIDCIMMLGVNALNTPTLLYHKTIV